MSRWTHYNPSPDGRSLEDCAVRALTKALGMNWETVYLILSEKGYQLGDMPHSNAVWGAALRERGFRRHVIPDTCPDCYTAEQFAEDHPEGVWVLGFGNHVATVAEGGQIFDSWDSSAEIPQYYWTKEEE